MSNNSTLEAKDSHKEVIDNYFVNGFNRVQAVLTVFPDMEYFTANVLGQSILDNERNKKYLDEKRSRLKASTDIRNENVLKELIQWAYADATVFMGLDEEEIKSLPQDVKRCIQSFKIQEKTTYDKAGRPVTNKIIEIKLVDKKSSMDAISKHIGFYMEDNNQKATKINLTKVDVNTLNMLLQAVEEGNT